MGKNQLFIILLFGLFFMNFAVAEESGGVLTGKQNECISLPQECPSCSYVKLTTIMLPPNMTKLSIQTNMVQDGTSYSYEFCNTTELGNYQYCTLGDIDGTDTSACNPFKITTTGDLFDNSQALMIISQLGLVALFIAMGFAFSKERWKMRTSFFIFGLMMAVIALNSIRVIAGTSGILSTMADFGLVLGIIILIFMIFYMMVYYTIEVFKYFKEKKRMKWEVSGQST
jgi:ABC-type glycerol-3-phosphate transport system permease component